MVRVKDALPALMLGGLSEVRLGTGLLMENVLAFEVPPPGVGFITVTLAVPAVLIALAGTLAWSTVPLTNVVVSWPPFQLTFDFETKLPPLTVSVKEGPPAKPVFGESEPILGTGLLTVKVRPLELPPPGG